MIDFITSISGREPPSIKIVAAISTGKVLFDAFQVLWGKLIVGGLAALAIITEEPAENIQQVPLVIRNTEPLIITNKMSRTIVGQALYPVITLLIIHFKGESLFKMDTKVKETMIFNIFVLWQVFIIFTTKRFEINNMIRRIRREKLFWTIVGTIIFLQVVIIELLKRYAGTERLNWMQWAVCFGIAAPAWPMGCLVNVINAS